MRLLTPGLCLLAVFAGPAIAQTLSSSYATHDGRAGTVVIACPSTDGSYLAGPCPMGRQSTVTYAAPASGAVAAANVPVTVFAAGQVASGCDIVNTGAAILYLDFTAPAAAGSSTSIPLQPGQSFHCPHPPAGAVTAVASQPQPFVAIRY